MKKVLLNLTSSLAVMLLLCFMATPAYAQDDDRGSKVEKTDAEKYAEKKPGKRSSGKGVAPKESAARQLARLDARANFAEALSSAITSAAADFTGEHQQYSGDDEEGANLNDAGGRFSTIAKSVSKEVIQNTVEVKKDTYYNKRTRRYTVYVCMEFNGEVGEMVQQTVNKMRQRVSPQDRKRIDENMKEFERKIEQELTMITEDDD